MKAIIACDARGGIGYQNKLPWTKIQGDLPRFKRLTENKTVVMGRNTWESLPVKPLPNRSNIVLSHTFVKGALTVNDLSLIESFTDAWVIGGAQTIKTCWSMIDEIHLTRTSYEYLCDTFIDLVKLEDEFTIVSRELYEDHAYEIWKRYD